MVSSINTKIAQGFFRLFVLLVCLFGFAQAGLATSVIVPTDENLAIEARAIVRGKVTAVSCSFDQIRDNVFTYVTLRVSDVIKGHITNRRIVIKQFGGEMSDNATIVYGSPQFKLGEEVILFLDTWQDGSLRVYQMFLGKVSLITDPNTGRASVIRIYP